MIINVWHGTHHDDAEVSEVQMPIGWNLRRWVERAKTEGGFYHGYAFIPWHHINYIEVPK